MTQAQTNRPLTQAQTIRTLADALEWFEKELIWGVSPAQLTHLTDRIGALFAAILTRGQMATSTNQNGYDVVSGNGEKISVKTITSSAHVSFKANTLELVHRVIVLRIAVEQSAPTVEKLLDCPVQEVRARCAVVGDELRLNIGSLTSDISRSAELKHLAKVRFGAFEIEQHESGTIGLTENGNPIQVVKPALRKIAAEIGVDLLNSAGNPKNTRSLGSDVIRAIRALADTALGPQAEG